MSTEDERKLFVAGLPDSITEEVLRQIFEATGGTVVDVSLPRHRDTGRPRGFGFVTLSSAEEAASARSSLDGSMQAGRSISVRPFQSEPPRREGGPGGGGGPRDSGPTSQGGGGGGPDRTLYVGNLPYDATQADVESLFSEAGAGPVVRIHLPTGPDGRARGFGFVTMGSAEAANGAIVALRDKDLKGRRLMVNIAHPRGERPSGDRPPRRDDAGPSSSFDRSGPPPSRDFDGPPPDINASAKPEGRRDRWDRAAEKKKKKKRGRNNDQPEPGRRGRVNPPDWEDWDD